MSIETKLNPKLDLVFERTTTVPAEKLWKGWTDPQMLMKWFCPRPWKVSDARINLQAGGEFYTLMQSPEGATFPNTGCYLEVIENKKLVWTNLMTEGFRPAQLAPHDFGITATLTLTQTAQGTLYRAVVCHASEDGVQKHKQMNFEEGWGMAFNQLIELIEGK